MNSNISFRITDSIVLKYIESLNEWCFYDLRKKKKQKPMRNKQEHQPEIPKINLNFIPLRLRSAYYLCV